MVHPAGRGVTPVRIAVVDDDRDLCDLLVFALERAGFEPVTAHDLASAGRLLDTAAPALVVLDINLGPHSGLDLLRALRRASDLPVILLTARHEEDDRVRGLELGADDYITKPFSLRELVARIRAVLRRTGHEVAEPAAPPDGVLRGGNLELDTVEHRVMRDGVPVNLTVTEFRLLHHLMAHAGAVVPSPVLLRHVWGYSDPTATDVVRVTIHRLRRKLADGAGSTRLLHTITGVGFMFKPESRPGRACRVTG